MTNDGTVGMVERVARAIHESQEPWDPFDIDREEWIKSARAAIAAMHEPTIARAAVPIPARDAVIEECAAYLEEPRLCSTGFNPFPHKLAVPAGWRSAADAIRALKSDAAKFVALIVFTLVIPSAMGMYATHLACYPRWPTCPGAMAAL